MTAQEVSLKSSSLELTVEQLDVAMAEQFPIDDVSSTDWGSSRASSADQVSIGCVVHPGSGNGSSETSMWEEWTQAADEGSTSNLLPDLTSTSDYTSRRVSFQHSDMLAIWLATFHPLAHPSLSSPDPVDDPAPAFMHAGLTHLDLAKLHHEMVDDTADAPLVYDSKTTGVFRQRLRALGPLSPSSPLPIHNGMLNPLGDPWDGCPTQSNSLQWSTVRTTGHTYIGHSARNSIFPDDSATAVGHQEGTITTTGSFAQKSRHTDIFIGPYGTFESATPWWTPQTLFDHGSELTKVGSTSVTPMKLMASLRELAGDATSGGMDAESKQNGCEDIIGLVSLKGARGRSSSSTAVTSSPAVGSSTVAMAGMRAGCKRGESTRTTQVAWPGKHRLELVDVEDGELDVTCSPGPLLKRPMISSVSISRYTRSAPIALAQVEAPFALQWGDHTLRGADRRSYCPASGGSAASQAMDILAVGPALNTNDKPRARRGCATNAQSVYARHRREKINERLKTLQHLVPNGAKVDIVTMLDEAIHYVRFLQKQVDLLKSDEFWTYATPNNYNGMDLSELSTYSQELE